ncbi:omega-amidase NIT2-like [Condylostylus longicornis]|uniref:omega-amidase NIT2-like n=1 Tax=Condylostylus longicornis TaxID=2530218 RepID=UPI00244E2973|nr:omega-amidase NIT2-like [Condylostylus longicornis]
MSSDTIKTALLQLSVLENKQENIKKAIRFISDVVAKNQVELVILPECFTGSYNVNDFASHAESVPNGEACQALSKIAKELKIYIIGGSVIEKDFNGKLYNTCTVWSPTGELIAKHRKIHLFHVEIDKQYFGGSKFNEAIALTPGNSFTTVMIKNKKFGIGICHDIRFDELARIYRNEGCEMLVYPSAFCTCQGPMHWELLQRGRATDNQLYVCQVSVARNPTTEYVAYGHTMLVDPWANVVCEASEKEEVLVVDIDFKKVQEVRRQIPIFPERRTDLYNTLKM